MARVLIIESDAPVANRMVQQLSARGAQVQVTADGAEGVNIARSFQPDVIVLCVELNRVSGYSICNKLKKDPELGRIPLMLTSSQATEETFEQHKKLKTRAEAYLKKPYTDEELANAIAPYLGGGGEEVDVALDELSVDIDDVSADGAAGVPRAERTWVEPTTLMSSSPAPSPPLAAPPPAATHPPVARAPSPAPAGAPPRVAAASAAGDAQVEQLRAENRQLRQKVQKLEETVEKNELAFNDRLLAESARGREGVEAKKKLGAFERDLVKYKDLADKAQAELAEARRELEEVRVAAKTGDSEKQTLATKIGQLVDKVKSLAAERDTLRAECDRLLEVEKTAAEERDGAAKLREKARKAVEIAMQLVDETGLSN